MSSIASLSAFTNSGALESGSALLKPANFQLTSPESMAVYLRSRLTYLGDQINDVFDREQRGQRVRSELHAIQTILAGAKVEGEGASATGTLSAADVQLINQHIDEIANYDIDLATDLVHNLAADGQILHDAQPAAPAVVSTTIGVSEGQRDQTSDPTAPAKTAQLVQQDVKFKGRELDASKDYLNTVSKELDSSSQMDMISLQQAMSAHQTAIQLATNLIAALADSAKAVATNIR